MSTEIINSTPDRELVASRVMNASQELAFRAWTEPEHLKNWWGPNGFTNTFNEFDLRPGGKWSFVMHGPNDDHYPNESVFIKIDAPKLLAFNHVSNPQFQIVATFEAVEENKTRVTFKMIFPTAAQRDQLKGFIGNKNEENLDRLEEELKRMEIEIKPL